MAACLQHEGRPTHLEEMKNIYQLALAIIKNGPFFTELKQTAIYVHVEQQLQKHLVGDKDQESEPRTKMKM